MASIPAHAIIAFTDGSANPNPGPCGAGAYLYSKDMGWEAEASVALGHGTNNLGEIWAVGAAIDLTMRNAPKLGSRPLWVLTDSKLTRDFILKKAKPKTRALKLTLDAVFTLIAKLPSHNHLRIAWVPAHVGIPENEHADYLAGLGSKASANNRVNVNRQDAYCTLKFAPD
jgi:ribonuclease HI